MPNLPQIQTRQERRLLEAFQRALSNVRDDAVIRDIERLLDQGDVDGVVDLLHLDRATFEPVEEEIRQAYRQGGLTGAEQIGQIPTENGDVAMRFSMATQGATQWLSQMSSSLITEIFEEQRQMARERLTEALNKGINPRTAALDLVGRKATRSGERQGGFIGLTSRQAQWVASARQELQSLNSNYFTRELRDKRFDGKVRKAIDNDEPLADEDINRMITQMQARTQRYRGQVIARTESINALRAGQFESIRQAAERGELDARDVTKGWDSSSDARTREDHLLMEATYRSDPIGLESAFVAPDGSRLMHPGDSSLGATAAQIIQCRCKAVYRINFANRVRRVEGFG